MNKRDNTSHGEHKKHFVIALIVAVILIIVVAVILINNSSSDDNQTSNDQTNNNQEVTDDQANDDQNTDESQATDLDMRIKAAVEEGELMKSDFDTQVSTLQSLIDNNNCDELQQLQATNPEGLQPAIDENRMTTWITEAEAIISEAGDKSNEDLTKLKDLINNPPEVSEELGESLIALLFDCTGLDDVDAEGINN